MMTTPDAALHFRVPPQPHQSKVVRENVIAFGSAHGIAAGDIVHLLTALGEAVANAIEHAATEAPIEIEVRLEPGRIVATVRDRGVGFDTATTTGKQLPAGTAERGRGLPIMRRCADTFSIASAIGLGTTVVLGVALPSAA